MKIEISIDGIRARQIEAVRSSPTRWYVRVNGQAARGRNARVRMFRSEDAAIAAGRKL